MLAAPAAANKASHLMALGALNMASLLVKSTACAVQHPRARLLWVPTANEASLCTAHCCPPHAGQAQLLTLPAAVFHEVTWAPCKYTSALAPCNVHVWDVG